jgi:hypothetical protein
MISFFRNIRLQLANRKKAGAYIRYAIGEILLIVIGILIALQVSNWNTNRTKKHKEIVLLKEIEKNLQFHLENEIIPAIKITKDKIEAYRLFKVAVKNYPNGITRDSIDNLLFTWMQPYDLEINVVPFENLKSVGVDLISNDNLRNEISHIYGYSIPYVLQRNQKHTDWVFSDIYPVMLDNLNTQEEPVSSENIHFLKTDESTINRFDANRYFMRQYVENLNSLQAGMDTLLSLIQKEIKRY